MSEIASAYVSLLPSAKGFGKKLDSQVSGEITKSGKKGGLSFGKLFAAGAALGIGAKGISFLGDSIAEGREAQKVGALTNAVIKSTGGIANVTAKDVDRLSTALSLKTGIDDEAIAAGQNMLLTFGNVRNEVGKGNDIFRQATIAATDMAAAFGGDAVSNSKLLGKALNDPTKGVSALTRVGVSFTEQQKEQIKTLQASGNALGAQKIILGEVSKQTAGAAVSQASASDKAAVAIGNLKEQIGTALLPVVDRLSATFTTKIVPAITGFITGMQKGTGAGGTFAGVLRSVGSVLGTVAGFINNNRTAVGTFVTIIGTVILAVKVWRGVQIALNFALAANPIGLVVVAIAGLAAALVYAYKKSTTFRNIVNAAFAGVKVAAAAVVGFFTTSVPAAFNKVKAAASSAIGWIKSNWPLILGILTGPFGIAAVLIVKNWDKIKAGGVAVVDFIKSIPGKITAVFAGAGTLLYNAGTQLMQGLASGIQNKITDAINAVQSGLSKIKGLLPGSPIKWGPLKNWNNGGAGKRLMDLVARGITAATPKTVEAAKTAFGKIGDALTSQRDAIKSTLEGLKSDFKSLSDSVSSAFTGNLFEATTGSDFVSNLMAKKTELTGLLRSFATLKGFGLDPKFLSQLFASGNGALITELAGMGKAGALNAGGLFADVTSLSSQLGNAVATNDPVFNEMKTQTGLLTKVSKQLEFLGSDIGKELSGAAAKAHRDKKGKK